MVWAAVGLYPLAGSDNFVLGAPRFASMRIRRDGLPRDLCITAHNLDEPGCPWVERVEVDGVRLAQPFVDFATLGGSSHTT